ncbi:MAG: glycosyltransferase family 4 protein, partial [Planctomycetota bacterium]
MSETGYSPTVYPTESVALATTMPQWRSSKARTLHLINGEHYSGAERVQDLLALQLPKFDYQVGFACVKPGKFPSTRLSDCPLYEVPMKSKTDLGMLQSLQNVVERDKYDIVHAHTPRTAVYGSLLSRATGLPLVYHVHSPVGRDSTRYLQNWINGQMERLSLSMVKRLITVSHSLGKYMKEEGHDEKIISVVPNG